MRDVLREREELIAAVKTLERVCRQLQASVDDMGEELVATRLHLDHAERQRDAYAGDWHTEQLAHTATMVELDAALARVRELEAEIADAFDAAVLRGAKPTTLNGRRKTLVELVTDALHSYLTTEMAFKNEVILTNRERAKVAALQEERDELDRVLHGPPGQRTPMVAALEKERDEAQENYVYTESMRQDCARRFEECQIQHAAERAKVAALESQNKELRHLCARALSRIQGLAEHGIQNDLIETLALLKDK